MANLRLPEPSEAFKKHSDKCVAYLEALIKQSANKITFAEYMHAVLYTPGLGYYSSGKENFGPGGDFTTASEITPLFAQAVTTQFAQIAETLGDYEILEFGAGSGKFALDVLKTLKDKDLLPQKYMILEVSDSLRHAQQTYIENEAPQFLPLIEWVTSLPDELVGIIFANEVMDAMPIHRMHIKDNDIHECYVTVNNDNQLCWMHGKPSLTDLEKKISKIEDTYHLSVDDYYTEINLYIRGWFNILDSILKKGAIILIDYGYPEKEYFSTERNQGTLRCFYQQRVHDDVFFYPSLQDITTSVNFTDVKNAGIEAGLTLAGYTTQMQFLTACGITDILSSISDRTEYTMLTQQVKKLLMPQEMGELYKVIAFSKKLSDEFIGFQLQDKRDDL